MKSLTIVFFAFFAATVANADVTKIGATHLNHLFDVDGVAINSCRSGKGKFSKLKLVVTKRPADIFDLKVMYGNGVWDDLPIRVNFGRRGQSRWIDLRGGKRCIRRVRIVGDSDGRRGRRSKVNFFAK